MSRRVVIGIGLLTSAIALIGLGCVVFGPVSYSYPPPGAHITAASTSLWDYGVGMRTILFLVAMVIAALSAGAGAYLRSRGEGAPALTLLWGSFALLIVGSVATLPGSTNAVTPAALLTDTGDSLGIGIYLAPAVGMAFLNALFCTIAAPESVRRTAATPR